MDTNKSDEVNSNALQNKNKKGKKSLNVGSIVDLVINETNNIF